MKEDSQSVRAALGDGPLPIACSLYPATLSPAGTAGAPLPLRRKAPVWFSEEGAERARGSSMAPAAASREGTFSNLESLKGFAPHAIMLSMSLRCSTAAAIAARRSRCAAP